MNTKAILVALAWVGLWGVAESGEPDVGPTPPKLVRDVGAFVFCDAPMFVRDAISEEFGLVGRSWVVGYPVLKGGQALCLIGTAARGVGGVVLDLGDGVKKVAIAGCVETPESFKNLTQNQLDALNSFAAGPIPRDQLPTFMRRAEKISKQRFVWFASPEIAGAARALPGDVIVWNPKELKQLEFDETKLFLILGECAHHVLKHVPTDEDPLRAKDRGLGDDFELAADKWAAERMMASGWRGAMIVRAAQQLYSVSAPLPESPPGKARIQKVFRTLWPTKEERANQEMVPGKQSGPP